jgi:hypothetical protein
MSLRFHEYVLRTDTERYIVSADTVIDVPLSAVFTRPMFGFTPAKQYKFNLGQWSYYVEPQERTIQQMAIVTIKRETVFVGPVEVKFANAAECSAARQKLQSKQADVQGLVGATDDLAPESVPAD